MELKSQGQEVARTEEENGENKNKLDKSCGKKFLSWAPQYMPKKPPIPKREPSIQSGATMSPVSV